MFVGDTNSANPLFRVGAEATAGLQLRISNEAARQLDLSDTQVIKGIVDQDTGTIQLKTETGSLVLPYQRSAYSPTVLWFRATRSAYGMILRPLQAKAEVKSTLTPDSGIAYGHGDSSGLVRRLLLTLSNHPSLASIWSSLNPAITQADSGKKYMQEEYRRLLGQLPRAADLDVEAIRSALSGISLAATGVFSPSVLTSLRLALLGKRAAGKFPHDGQGLDEALKPLQEYLESARVESLLSQEQGRIFARFPMFFADAPPVELTIAEQGRSGQEERSGWLLDLEMQLPSGDKLWLNCLFNPDWEVKATAWTTDQQLASEMKHGLAELKNNLASFGLQLASLQIIEGVRSRVPTLPYAQSHSESISK